MKISLKKNLAMTLSEVMIVFLIIGIIAALTSIAINKATTKTTNKYMTTAALVELKQALGDIIADDSDSTLPTTGPELCDLLTNTFNTVGTISRTSTTSSGFNDTNFNFKTTNGMRFYHVGANVDANGDFYIYVDIDGANRKSVLNEDIIKFQIHRNGAVYPAYDSIAATSTDYLTASSKYTVAANSSTDWVVLATNYRDAICKSGLGIGTYCTAPPPISANTNCTNGTWICELVLQKPKNFAEKK